ncbi:uncharacterized protein ACOB8E_004346 [Sarcophilus harrisii]
MALKMQNSLVVKYNPQTDGCLKSIRSFVIRILSLVLTMNPTDWDHHLHKVFFLQNRCSDYSEEEDEDDLRKLHGESPGAAWAPPPQVPELPQPSPESQKEPPAKGRGEDTCLYCCRLPDEGDSDVFAVVSGPAQAPKEGRPCHWSWLWGGGLADSWRAGQGQDRTGLSWEGKGDAPATHHPTHTWTLSPPPRCSVTGARRGPTSSVCGGSLDG